MDFFMEKTQWLLLRGLKLLQKPYIIFEEEAEVVDLVFKHGYPLNPHSECKAGILLSIYLTIFHYRWVYHSATTNFYPTGVLTHRAAFTAAYKAGYIYFRARLSKGKKDGRKRISTLRPNISWAK